LGSFFLQSFIPGLRKYSGPFEFIVRGFLDTDLGKYPGTETNLMLFHFKYLTESIERFDQTLMFLVEIDDPARGAEIGTSIDALFENSGEETVTESEKAFSAGFISLIGDLGALINGIGLAVCFTILLVTANTMSMAVRERRREIAVLKTVGFGSGQVMGLIVTESLVLGLSGGLLGILGTHVALNAMNDTPGQTLLAISHLELQTGVALTGLSVALGLGLAAGFFPAWGAYRARVTEMLRSL
jgi:putative ABC transport system permease protein